jgi:hypothetical protein
MLAGHCLSQPPSLAHKGMKPYRPAPLANSRSRSSGANSLLAAFGRISHSTIRTISRHDFSLVQFGYYLPQDVKRLIL